MELTTTRTDIFPTIKRLSVVAGKPSDAIRGSILFSATGESLTLTATDSAMTASRTLKVNVAAHGTVAIPASNLSSVLSVIADGPATFALDPETNRVTVKSGRSKYTLTGLAATDFPPAPTPITGTPLTIDAAHFRRIVDQTWFSVAPDDNRYGLNGAHIDAVDTPDGRMLRMVSTDGNRLSWAQAPFSGNLGIGRRMLLPRKPLGEVRKMIDGYSGPVEIRFGERAAEVSFEGTTVNMRLLEAEFPNYKEVMPIVFKRRIMVTRLEILESLRRVGVFAVDSSHSIRLACSPDGIVFTARKLDSGDAREELGVKSYDGQPIILGTNGHYLMEVLNACNEDTVRLSIGEELSPIMIQPMESDDQPAESCLFIIMPVRLE